MLSNVNGLPVNHSDPTKNHGGRIIVACYFRLVRGFNVLSYTDVGRVVILEVFGLAYFLGFYEFG